MLDSLATDKNLLVMSGNVLVKLHVKLNLTFVKK